MGMKDSAKSVAATLRLDSHHAIERFGVIFAAIAVSFVLIFLSASTSSVANQSAQLDSTTLYTPTFTTSKTQLSGDVAGVYVSTDRTRAMVLMQFKDASSMSSDATKYQGFLTGSSRELNDQPLKSAITGEIVVFGSTGYMAMVLDSDQPFEQQILNLTLRANSELVYRPSESRKVREDLAGQKTFAEFDQWRLYFNPGASKATVTEALDTERFDAGAVYDHLVVDEQEAAIRESMDEQLAQMQVDLARIAEYEADARRVNVDGVSLDLPEVPEQIAGDAVTGDASVDGKESTLALRTNWVSPRGFDFDWRSGTVGDGYLDEIVPEDQSYVTWLAAKSASTKDDSEMRVNDLEWALSNGQLLKDFSTSDAAMQPLFDIRNDLSQAYQDYYKRKLEYQVDSYGELLALDVNLRNVRASSSTNDSEKALFTY